jgi:Tfp pilus assembly protein PilO
VNGVASPVIIKRPWAIDRQQLLILLAAAVMVGSFCLLVLWPKHCELQDLGLVVTQRREVVNEKVRTSQEGIYVSARLSSLRQMQEHLLDRLPDEPQLADFLQAVAQCVEAEPGVTHEIERTVAVPEGSVAAVPIRLRLVGSFEGVYRCLAGIERLERMNRFRRVQVGRTEDGTRVVAEADILVYYLESAEETPRPATPKSEVISG